MDKQRVEQALKEILEVKGQEIVQNHGAFKAAVFDFLDEINFADERLVLDYAMRSNSFWILLGTTQVTADSAKRAVEQMQKESRMAREDAEFVVQCVAAVRGVKSPDTAWRDGKKEKEQKYEKTGKQTVVTNVKPKKAGIKRIIGGMIGAVLGGALGVLCMIILTVVSIKYVPAVSGVVLAFCTVMGWRLLGKRLTKAGIIVCCAVMLGMGYLGWFINVESYNEMRYDEMRDNMNRTWDEMEPNMPADEDVQALDEFWRVYETERDSELDDYEDELNSYAVSFVIAYLICMTAGAVPTIIIIRKRQGGLFI